MDGYTCYKCITTRIFRDTSSRYFASEFCRQKDLETWRRFVEKNDEEDLENGVGVGR